MKPLRPRPLWKASRAVRHSVARALVALILVVGLSSFADAQVRGDDDEFVRIAPRDVALFRGRPEFIAIGPPGQSAPAAEALEAAGAQLLRLRRLPGLNLQAQVFDLRGRLALGQAQAVLAQVAPATVIDANVLYRYAQGSAPRLYAAELVGDAAPGACRLPALRVGIIDGPVNTDHPALRTARITTFSTLGPGDRAAASDHGTGVAAIIVGEDPSGALSGFARGAHLHAVSAFAAGRDGAAADVERIGAALDVLQRNGVRLVNMSFAGPRNRALERLLGAVTERGMATVAAVGNDAATRAAWPAAAPAVIAVTAVDAARRRYPLANTGPHVEYAAPGVDLFVAMSTGGGYASGTSYAAPIVTALAARAMARGVAEQSLRVALRGQTEDIGPPGRDTAFGWGIIRASGC